MPLDVLDLLGGLDLVFGLLGSTSIGGRVRRWFWYRISESWPTAQASVLSGRIQELQGRYVVSVAYWFYAAGDRYGGRYEGQFTDETKARDTLRCLLGSPPLVRYKPGHPDTSVLYEG